MKKRIALIPAYEPQQILVELSDLLIKEGFELIVVDDGSGEEFRGIFQALGNNTTLLTHSQNLGKGAALKTGFSYIQDNIREDCVIVTVDADGQHRIEDALRLCEAAEETPNTLILGSRTLKNNVPLRSRIGNTITRWVYRLSTGLKIHDTQTGLRAFDFQMLPQLLAVSGSRYEYEMNVLLEFARNKAKMREITVETIYIENNAASHFDTVRDSIRVYKEILKFSASSFIGFLLDYAAYSLLYFVTQSLWLSNLIARLISSSVNFTLNKRFVFKSEENVFKAALKYFLLAAIILLGNTFFLDFLVNICDIHQMVAKIITEVVFFTLSWLVQRLLIFRKRRGDR